MKKWSLFILWFLISVLGASALGLIAFSRGEPINAVWIVIAGVCAMSVSYRFYSKWLVTQVLVVDERRAPPSITHQDGNDFVPTHSWMVFGHHFAAIAGPGPLVGPVLAAQFGYLPGTLWLIIGATLAGGVHDLIVLFASVRRGGKSLSEIIRDEIGAGLGLIALLSVLSILIILIAVLGLVVVKAMAESPWGVFTIATTIPIALLMGCGQRYLKLGVGAVTVFGLVGLAFSVWGGQFLHHSPVLEAWFTRDAQWLAWAVMLYGLAATALPVWLLLTPRDYLSTFMKLGAVVALAAAVILLRPQLHMPALTPFIDGTGPVFAGPVFPFVCITIACGAISGFHALVASGTTPKMIERESVIRPVGYGAMVVEMVVGLMALVAACSLQPGQYFAINLKGTPDQVVATVNALGYAVTTQEMQTLANEVGEKTLIGRTGGAPTFAVGMAHMFSRAFSDSGAMALWYHFAIMFEALFILTTIDAGTRVGRFLLQELLGKVWRPLGDTRHILSNGFASVLLVGAWGVFLYQGVVDPLGGVNSLWPIFGIANQLLAVLGLCVGTTLLIKMNKVRHLWITLLPLLFLTTVTYTAGWIKVFDPDPKLGFLAGARYYDMRAIAENVVPNQVRWQQQAFNQQLDAVVTLAFLVLVSAVLIGSVWEWSRLLRGTKRIELKESPFVPV